MRFARTPSRSWRDWVVAVVVVAAAVGLRAGPLSTVGVKAPYLTFYPAVMIAALYGGMYPVLLATALCSVAATYWVAPVGRPLTLRDPIDLLGLAIFVAGCTVISLACEATNRAREDAHNTRTQLTISQERQRANEALDPYELLARHSRDIILFIRKSDGRIVECNEAAEHSYGQTRLELCSLTIHDIRMPGDRLLTEWQMDVADAAGALFETIHRRKDGSTFPVEVSSSGSTIDGERCVLSVIRDITKRKQTEGARREAEAYTRAILDAATESIYLFSADGIILSANETAAWRLHRTVSEIVGKPFTDLVPADVAEKRQHYLTQVIASGNQARFEDERDGIVFDHAFCPVFGSEGEVDRVAVFSRDVTERDRAELALAASESRYRDLVESIPAMVWATDAQGNTPDHNRRWHKYTGQSPERALGDGWRDTIHPDDLQRVSDLWSRCVQSGSDYAIEYRIRRASDGAYRWHSVAATLRRDNRREPIGWFGTCADIGQAMRYEVDANEVQA